MAQAMTVKRNSADTDLVLYYHPCSYYSQKVIMLLYQKKLPFKPAFVDIQRGKQFSKQFLGLNPRGEVPVLVDQKFKVIPGSENIMDYLEDNFTNGSPSLRPSDPDCRKRADQLHELILKQNVEAITFGSVMHHDDLGLNPKLPYENPTNLSRLKELIKHRSAIIRTEVVKNPEFADELNKKLHEVRTDSALWEDRDKYEGLLIMFEQLLDEIEAELFSHDDDSWWLCSPELSIADISLSILLNRLWQLGFERRMWERNRPLVGSYFARVQQLQSFKAAISMSGGSSLVDIADLLSNPLFWGLLGVVAVAGGSFYLWSKAQNKESGLLLSLFGVGESDSQTPLGSRFLAPAANARS